MLITRSVWRTMVREGWSVRAAAEKLEIDEATASEEMDRVRPSVRAAIVEATVAAQLRSRSIVRVDC